MDSRALVRRALCSRKRLVVEFSNKEKLCETIAGTTGEQQPSCNDWDWIDLCLWSLSESGVPTVICITAAFASLQLATRKVCEVTSSLRGPLNEELVNVA